MKRILFVNYLGIVCINEQFNFIIKMLLFCNSFPQRNRVSYNFIQREGFWYFLEK
jgi:hypothetical protein